MDLGGRVVDVGTACTILDAWDRTMNPEAVGAAIWLEFWPNVRGTSGLYAVPFDAADPVTTPRGIDLGNPAVRTAALQALAEAVAFLTDNEIPLDAPWGQVHFEERNGERIPIHGGPGTHGVYNAISSRFRSGAGYTPITGGSSIVTVVTFGRQGPLARAVLTYSQSTDPESPHFADQTKLFSAQGINPLPFALRDIKRDPNLEVKKLRERRR